MEDLWRIQNSGVDIEDFADYAEYRRFLKRFCDDEEDKNRRRFLYGDDKPTKRKEPAE